MSQMRMFVIEKDGDLREFATFDNSCRGWKLMWDWFEHLYFPIEPGRFSMFIEELFHPEIKELVKKFWHLAYEERVPAHQRVALRCSYDGAMVRRESFAVVVSAMRQVAAEMEKAPWMVTSLSFEPLTLDADSGHLKAIADKVDEAAKQEGVIGCCWQYSTGDGDPWNEGRIHVGDEDSDVHRPFNVFKDKNPPAMQWWLNPTSLEGDDEVDVIIA